VNDIKIIGRPLYKDIEVYSIKDIKVYIVNTIIILNNKHKL